MQISSSALSDIGSNYYVKLNDKEVLIYEEDEASKSRKPHIKSLKELEKDEQNKTKESSKETSSKELSVDEKRLVGDLQSRDSEVRAHEAAHQAAGGGMTGGATYTYQKAPDGRMYAIGGEVSISTKAGATPEETISNARQIVAAAMAAGDPSPQDFAVASSARVMEMKAVQQIAKKEQEEIQGKKAYGAISSPSTSHVKDKGINLEPFDISA